jgi:hypothetical protein
MNEYIAGASSVVDTIFLQDSASTTGAGKTGLAFNTASLTCYYKRSNGTASVAVTLADITTLGTFTSGGFKAIDGTNMPGLYEFHPPDAAFASGAKEVTFFFQGASGLVPRPIKYRILGGLNPDDAVRAGLTALPNAAAGANTGLPLSVDAAGRVDVLKINGTSQTARDLGASVLLSVGTGAGQLNVSGGKAPATLAAADVTGNVAADLQTIKTQTVTCAGGVTIPAATLASTTNITAAAGVVLSAAGVQAIWDALTSALTTAGSIGKRVVDYLGGGSKVAATVASGDDADAASVKTTIGVAGVGLTNLGDTRVAHLDADISSRMATYTQPAGFLAATFPATVASPTNITAGTITTVTNLTNAPAAGDFTAAMKTSLNAATPASVVGNVGGIAGTTQTLDALQTALSSAHGAGSWATATGFSTLDAAGVRLAVGLASANLDTQLGGISSKTTNLPADPADASDLAALFTALQSHGDSAWATATGFVLAASAPSWYTTPPSAAQNAAAVGTRQMVESYAADGVAPTLDQAVFLIQQYLTEFVISGTAYRINKLDGTTQAAALTLNDATNPTGATRSA